MCLLSLLDEQPASTQGLFGKVVHPSLLGSLSWYGVASNSQQSCYPSFLNAGTRGVHRHAWPGPFVVSIAHWGSQL